MIGNKDDDDTDRGLVTRNPFQFFLDSFLTMWMWLYINNLGANNIADVINNIIIGRPPISLAIFILDWVVNVLAIISSIGMLCFMGWNFGVESFAEFKVDRKKDKLVIFHFWQACLVTYFSIRFALTFYTGKHLDIFDFIYYVILMALSVFGLLTSLTCWFVLWEDFQKHDIAYGQITDCPVKLDDETETFSITCKQGVIALPVAWLVPIKIRIDQCSLYVYFRHPDTPFIQYNMFTFDSEVQAELAKKTIDWQI